MKRIGILISGGGSNMVSLVRSMTADHPARAALVLSNNPEAGGLAKAAEMDVPTAVVDHRPYKGDRPAFEAKVHRELIKNDIDIVCLAGFMRILSAGFTEKWAGRMLNIHPSLLPKYRGLHTHERALDAGDAEAGCTVHEVTAHLDDGPILGQARVPILPGDTPDVLAARVLEQEHLLYPKVLERFVRGDKTPVYLPSGDASPINAGP